jgi:hypothetical protein
MTVRPRQTGCGTGMENHASCSINLSPHDLAPCGVSLVAPLSQCSNKKPPRAVKYQLWRDLCAFTGNNCGTQGEMMTNIPETMTAIDIVAPGGPEVLRTMTRPVPVPGASEVLIRVAAAGINRPDILQRLGKYNPPVGTTRPTYRDLKLPAPLLRWGTVLTPP